MTLAALIARLGVAEVARRAGVSTATIERWRRRGPSKSGAESLSRIAANHARSVKAARTRKEGDAFTSTVPSPPKAELPDQKVKPRRKPTRGEQQKAAKKADLGTLVTGVEQHTTKRYVGERTWIAVDKPLPEVDPADITSTAMKVWMQTGRQFAQVILLIFRFVPVNPAYAPTHHLYRKQGQWIEQWESTQHLAQARSWARTEEILGDSVLYLFGPGLSSEWGPTMGLSQQAETRVLWFSSMCVKTFDERPEGWERPLRHLR